MPARCQAPAEESRPAVPSQRGQARLPPLACSHRSLGTTLPLRSLPSLPSQPWATRCLPSSSCSRSWSRPSSGWPMRCPRATSNGWVGGGRHNGGGTTLAQRLQPCPWAHASCVTSILPCPACLPAACAGAGCAQGAAGGGWGAAAAGAGGGRRQRRHRLRRRPRERRRRGLPGAQAARGRQPRLLPGAHPAIDGPGARRHRPDAAGGAG